MNKDISFKLWYTVLIKGICQFIRKIAELFGYKDGTTFGQVIWRIFATCFTLLFVMLTIVLTYAFFYEVVYRDWIRPHSSEIVYNDKRLSNHIVFQELRYHDKGRVYDEFKKRVVIKDVDWVVVSEDKDSLAVFAKDGKRGYLNRFSGEIVLPAIYSKAWVFSEGIAAVEKDKKLLFIDHSGNIVIDNNFDVHYNDPQYAFNDGYCIVRNGINNKVGLIDRQGNWALNPEYDTIVHEYKFWKATKDNVHGLFSETLDTLFRVENPDIYIGDDVIEVRFPDHTAKRFDYRGNLLVDFVIDNVENMHYATTKLRNGDEEEGDISNLAVYDVAKCQKYMVRSGSYDEYFGLLDRSGKRITPPDYSSIGAIAEDLYLCQPQGIIINGKGEKVK